MEDRTVDVRPELFEHKRGSIDANIDAPFLRGVSKGTFWRWVVQIGDAGSRPGSDYLAIVEG
jgi:hypothetical protein